VIGRYNITGIDPSHSHLTRLVGRATPPTDRSVGESSPIVGSDVRSTDDIRLD
jgi:hypothetical protein